MESNNIFGVLDKETNNIIPLSELMCPECGDSKTQCHNTFKNFPKGRCTVGFFDCVYDVICGMGRKQFTIKEFHKNLAADVYPDFIGITEPERLSIEILDVYLDLGVVEGIDGNGNLFREV